MARTNATNFSGALQFPYATAGTDIFKKEDVQTLAHAVDQHDHTTGKGLPPPAGSITSGMIADGTITAADIADATITNAKLGSDVARANLLANGGFEIWQRGAGPFTGSLVYGPDRWMTNLGSGSTMSITRVAGADGTSTFAAQIVYTHSAASQLYQKVVNNSDLNELRGTSVSFSARVNSNAANAVQLNLFDSGGLNAVSAFHPGGSTWQTLTVTGTVSGLGAGGELHARLQFAASATVQVDDACLVVGSQPANYVPLHPADDLARCLRYYEPISVPNGTTFALVQGSGTGGIAGPFVPWKTKKALTPTLTFFGTFNIQVGNGSATAVTPGSGGQSVDGFNLGGTVAVTNGTVYIMTANSAGAIGEANP